METFDWDEIVLELKRVIFNLKKAADSMKRGKMYTFTDKKVGEKLLIAYNSLQTAINKLQFFVQVSPNPIANSILQRLLANFNIMDSKRYTGMLKEDAITIIKSTEDLLKEIPKGKVPIKPTMPQPPAPPTQPPMQQMQPQYQQFQQGPPPPPVPPARPPVPQPVTQPAPQPVYPAQQSQARVAPPGKKFCIRCGAQIPENAKFCPYCGAPQPVRIG
ncbi:MAG: zinc ribbon domain-containing protein [Candidatus Asgardarchaeia archaeon]